MTNFNVVLTAETRNVVRALVRGHSGFEAWRIANGDFDSRDMTKSQTMEAITALGLEQQVLDIVNAPAPAPAPIVPESVTAGIRYPDTETESAPDTGDADAMTASVLDPIRPFLAPTILDTIASALAPIVAQAVKPAVTIEKEIVRTVTIDENGIPVTLAPEPEQAKRTGETTLGKLYGFSRFKHSSAKVALWNSQTAPKIDPFYVPEPSTVARLVTAVERGRNVWLGGPKGSGKTSLPTQYAARAKRPMVRVAFHRTIDPVDLIGQLIPEGKAGLWKWRDGLLLRAIRTPGMVILLDEITATPPGLTLIIQTLIDERYVDLPTGERVHCADGVVFVCADNTFGFGDQSGVYAGTMVANAALVDRMARMIRVDYLPADLESQALANHTGAPRAACDRVVNFVVSSRKLSGLEDRPVSLRQMIAFVEMVQDGFTVKEAFEDTMLTRLPDAERAILNVHFGPTFDGKAFEAELEGIVQPVLGPVSEAPEQAKAREAFDEIDMNN